MMYVPKNNNHSKDSLFKKNKEELKSGLCYRTYDTKKNKEEAAK